MPDPRFPDRLRLPLEFDPARLAADMANFTQSHRIEHFVKQNYDGDWSVIALRGPAGAAHPIRMIYSDPAASSSKTRPCWRPRAISRRCWPPSPARCTRCG